MKFFLLYNVLWCSMMFYDVLWCFMMFYDVLWFWVLRKCIDSMVFDTREVLRWFGLDTRETLRWYGSDPSGEVEMVWFDPSGGVEMVWFWSLGRRLVWSRKLGRCKRLRDLISEKIVWFRFLGRRWYDLGSSGDAVSWWPPSGEVIIPWAGYPK